MASDDLVTVDGAQASSRKRAEKTKRTFLDASGIETPRANLNSVAGRITFVESGETLDFSYDDLTPEVSRAAALFGIMTSVTNTVGRADMSAAEIYEAAENRLKTIVEDGLWTSDRQSGPASNIILEAIARRNGKKGLPFTDEDRARYHARLSDEKEGNEFKAKILAQPSVRVEYEAIKAERQAERLKRLQAKAAAAESDAEPDDLADL